MREEMVIEQLIARGIKDERVLEAFRRVPRREFVPSALQADADDDRPLPIGEEQTISQPYMVAIMTELLKLEGGEQVLEVGTGSGYQAAILAELGARVITIERFATLSEQARSTLARLGYAGVECVVGDGSEGYPAGAPYDAIVVTAGCPAIPPPLAAQLAEGGRLVVPVGDREIQTLIAAVRAGGQLKRTSSVPCRFVPLIGKFGWPE